MFNKHTLTFKKQWKMKTSTEGEVITDDCLIEAIIRLTSYYKLKLIKVSLSDTDECRIVIKGNRDLYLSFVQAMLKEFKGLLKKIWF